MTRAWCLAAVLGIGLGLGGGSAMAAPLGFKDSWMLMTDLGPNWQEVWVNHAFTARDAAGAGVVRMKSDDSERRRTLVEATYTRLLKRWNLPQAQANVWLFAGAGGIRGNDFEGTRFALTPGLQVDYETTRVYLAATARLYRAEEVNHDVGSVRAGFSFYEVDYDEIQPWFVVEVRRMRGMSEKLEVTPMLRLIHNRFFVEAGVNNSRQVRANLMYTF